MYVCADACMLLAFKERKKGKKSIFYRKIDLIAYISVDIAYNPTVHRAKVLPQRMGTRICAYMVMYVCGLYVVGCERR